MTEAITSYEEGLFAICRHAFATILRRDGADECLWRKRSATIDRHGLLSFVLPSPFKPKPIELSEDRLDDPVYRRKLVRQLQMRRPGKYVNHTVRVDRARLAEPEYVDEIARLLACKWVARLGADCNVDRLILLRLDADMITWLLDHKGPHQISASAVAKLMLRLEIESLVRKHPLMIEAERAIREAGENGRRAVGEVMRVEGARLLEEFTSNSRKLLDKVGADADRFIEKMRRDGKAAREESERRAAAHSDPDPERSFRASVDRRIAAHRHANRMGFWPRLAVWTAGAAAAGALFFFMEINGVTPAQFIVDRLGG